MVLYSSWFNYSGLGCSTSRARSSFTPREALSSTTSPSRRFSLSQKPACSASSTNSADLAPAARAPSTMAWPLPRTPRMISMPAKAAASPQARCNWTDSRPSSSISPATRMRRFAGMEARVWIMERSASGLEL